MPSPSQAREPDSSNSGKEEIDELEETDTISDTPDKPIVDLRTKTQTKLAYFFVVGFLLLLTLPFFYLIAIVVYTHADIPTLNVIYPQVIDMIKTLVAVLGGLVGAIVTYYFAFQEKR